MRLFKRRAVEAARVEPVVGPVVGPVSMGPVIAAQAAAPVAFNPARALGWDVWGGSGSGSRVATLPPVNPEIMQRHATVTACCAVVAGDLSKLPLNVVEVAPDGQESVIIDHPLSDLLNVESSDGVPASVMRFALVYAFLLRGNAYAFAPRDGRGDPVLIETIDAVSMVKRGRDRVYHFTDQGDVGRRCLPRNMVHLRYMALDGWTGRSPLRVASESMALALAGQEAAARSASGVNVRGIAKLGAADGSDEDFDRASRRMKQAVTGEGGVAIIGRDDSFENISMTAADLELLASRRFDREQIASLYRVPPTKLQMLEYGVKANGEQQAIDYRADCLSHWAEPVQGGLEIALLTGAERAAGLRLRHDYSELMLPTAKELTDTLTKAVGGPYMHYEEARRVAKLGPLPAGMVPYPPPNMTAKPEDGKGKENG